MPSSLEAPRDLEASPQRAAVEPHPSAPTPTPTPNHQALVLKDLHLAPSWPPGTTIWGLHPELGWAVMSPHCSLQLVVQEEEKHPGALSALAAGPLSTLRPLTPLILGHGSHRTQGSQWGSPFAHKWTNVPVQPSPDSFPQAPGKRMTRFLLKILNHTVTKENWLPAVGLILTPALPLFG